MKQEDSILMLKPFHIWGLSRSKFIKFVIWKFQPYPHGIEEKTLAASRAQPPGPGDKGASLVQEGWPSPGAGRTCCLDVTQLSPLGRDTLPRPGRSWVGRTQILTFDTAHNSLPQNTQGKSDLESMSHWPHHPSGGPMA